MEIIHIKSRVEYLEQQGITISHRASLGTDYTFKIIALLIIHLTINILQNIMSSNKAK
jgi:hypothetical protein